MPRKSYQKIYYLAALLLLLGGSIALEVLQPETRLLKTDVTISSNTEYTSNTTTNDNVIINSGVTVTLDGAITWQINGNLTVNGTITFEDTDADSPQDYTDWPTLKVSGNVTIDAAGSITADGKGFAGGAAGANNGGGSGGGIGSATLPGGGGGHGGIGGEGVGTTSAAGARFGSTLTPTTAGSGGGGGANTAGGAGGGVIRIDIAGTTTINGTITVDGSAGTNGSSTNKTGGGGAGGSIYLTTETLNGTGSLTSTGGRGGNNTSAASTGGGGGGGGRIATYFNTPGADIATLKSNASVLGGVGGDSNGTQTEGYTGEPGNLFFLDVDAKDIEIYNGPDFFQEGDTITLSGTQATFTGAPKFGDSDATTNDNDATFDSANSTTRFDDITIKANATTGSKIASGNTIFDLTINYTGIFTIASPTNSDGSCRTSVSSTTQDSTFDTCFYFEKLTLTGPTLTVNTNAQLLGDGNGNTGGATGANNGNGTGGGVSSTTGGGGGHGGVGGRGSQAGATGGASYGSTLVPTTAGSGGAGGTSSAGGNGGGVVRIDISGTLTVNGTVTVDGTNGGDNDPSGGGGAGGSIYITAETVDGSGSLTATGGRGGNEASDNYGGGGGAGGRIATYFNTPGANIATLKSNTSVLGGVGGNSANSFFGFIGEVGTLFFLEVDAKDIEIYNGNDFFQEGDTITLSGTQATFTGNPKFGDSDATTNDNDATFDSANATTRFDDITMKANAYIESKVVSGSTAFALTIDYTGIFTTESPTTSDGSCRSFGQATSQDSSFDTCFVGEKITLIGPTLTINANAQINVDGYGFAGGAAGANNGGGDGGGISSTTGGGGGHGAAGGKGYQAGATGGVSYGSNTDPVTLGSGGAGGTSSAGGNGGGAIRLDISGTMTLNGILTADGTNGGDNNPSGGGGAGGSIFITSTTFAGSGSMTVTGGRGGNEPADNYAGGGGGGGRIAYYYNTLTYTGSTSVAAGAGGTSANNFVGTAGSNGTTLAQAYIVATQPSVSSPTTQQVSVSVNLTPSSSAFTSGTQYKSHTSTDWEIYNDAGLAATNKVWSKATDTSNKTSTTVNTTNGTFENALSGQTALASGTRYWIRTRYNNIAGASSWSTTIAFKTTISDTTTTQNWTLAEATTNYTYDNTKISINSGNDSLGKLIATSGEYAFTSGPDSTTRRQKITVTENSGSTLTNFPVKISVTYDADMQADFDDIRFTTSDGATEIDYWLETKTDSSSATIWVEVPSITASSTATIYMYYGNASATSESNGSNVFDFFDDFTGGSLNASNWDTDGFDTYAGPTNSVSGGVLTLASNGSSWRGLRLIRNFAPSDTMVVEQRFKKSANSQWHASFLVDSTAVNTHRLGMYDGYQSNAGQFGAQIAASGSFSTPNNFGSFSTDTWYIARNVKSSSTSLTIEALNDARTSIDSTATTQAAWSGVTWNWVTWVYENVNVSYDWFIVRKYASTEPSSSFGAEQASSSYDGVKIVPASAGTHPTYTALYSFTETLGGSNAGSTKYQISLDGTNWYYHNGTSWTAITTDSTDNDTAAEVNFWIDDFDTAIGTGDFYYKAFLVSNGNQAVEIDNLALTYTSTPSTPSISSPSNSATGVARAAPLTSSTFSGSPGHTSTDWEISTDNTFTGSALVAYKYTDTTNLTSMTVNSTNFTFQNALSGKTILSSSTTYYARVRYTNAAGTSSYSSAISFTTTASTAPDTPSITSPSNSATGQSRTLTLTSSAFSDSESDSHTSSDWDIATDNTFSTIVATKSSDTTNKTSIVVNSTNFTFQNSLAGRTQLLPSTTYYARVRYKDSESTPSAYSSTITFATLGNTNPTTPTISAPTNGATGQARNQVITSSNFSDADTDDAHQSSDWEVATDNTFTGSALLAYKYSDTSNKTSIGINSTNFTFQNALSGLQILQPQTTYYVRIRHKDDREGTSNWSSDISFTTGTNTAPNKPSITSPTSGATEVSTTPTITSSDFSDPDDSLHTASSWQMYDNSSLASSNLVWSKNADTTNKTSITVNDTTGTLANSLAGRTKLLPGTTYYIRTLHTDPASADSEWASTISFTTVAPPSTPVLSSSSHPSETAYFSNATPNFTVTVSTPTPNHYHYLVNQTASPTKLQVEVGTQDDDGIFTVPTGTIASNGTWYVHIIGHDLNHNPSQTFDSYIIKYDSGAPTISSVTASNITGTTASIAWNTLNSSNSRVDYGTSSSNYTLVATDSTLTTSHQVNLSNLSGSTTYYYKVTSVDAYSQSTVSSEQSFTTIGLTTISSVSVTNIAGTSAIITWTTNHAATSKVNYGVSTTYGFDIQDSALVTSHSLTVTALTAGTTYYYEIISVGNSTATDAYHTFQTTASTPTTSTTPTTPTTSSSSSGSSGSSYGGGGSSGSSSSSSNSSSSSSSQTTYTPTSSEKEEIKKPEIEEKKNLNETLKETMKKITEKFKKTSKTQKPSLEKPAVEPTPETISENIPESTIAIETKSPSQTTPSVEPETHPGIQEIKQQIIEEIATKPITKALKEKILKDVKERLAAIQETSSPESSTTSSESQPSIKPSIQTTTPTTTESTVTTRKTILDDLINVQKPDIAIVESYLVKRELIQKAIENQTKTDQVKLIQFTEGKKAIEFLQEAGFSSPSISSSLANLDTKMTRCELVRLLTDNFIPNGLPTPEETPFTDLLRTSPCAASAGFLKNAGIIKGYDDGTFRGTQKAKYPEALKMILETTAYFYNITNEDLFLPEELKKVKLIEKDRVASTFTTLLRNIKSNIFDLGGKHIAVQIEEGVWYEGYLDFASKYGILAEETFDPAGETTSDWTATTLANTIQAFEGFDEEAIISQMDSEPEPTTEPEIVIEPTIEPTVEPEVEATSCPSTSSQELEKAQNLITNLAKKKIDKELFIYTSLDQISKRISEKTAISIEVKESVKNTKKSLNINNATVRDTLNALSRSGDIIWTVNGGKIVIGTPADFENLPTVDLKSIAISKIACPVIKIQETIDSACGNGIREEKESCDDGNTEINDGCSAECNEEETAETSQVTLICTLPNAEEVARTSDFLKQVTKKESNIRFIYASFDSIIQRLEKRFIIDVNLTEKTQSQVKMYKKSIGKDTTKLSFKEVLDTITKENKLVWGIEGTDITKITIKKSDEESPSITDIASIDVMLQQCGSTARAYCGDGVIQSPNDEKTGGPKSDGMEDCDDGENGSATCTSDCQIIITIPKIEIVNACGDGTKAEEEECDDGNIQNNDGCSAECKIETVPPSTPQCGNQVIEEGEECDDGGSTTCTTDCKKIAIVEPPPEEEPPIEEPPLHGGSESYCGDGITQTLNDQGLPELCDDGNGNSGDGCSSNCQTESITTSGDIVVQNTVGGSPTNIEITEEKINECESVSGTNDEDSEGLSDELECWVGTDPENPDTDEDSISDADEILEYQTDPKDSQSIPNTEEDAMTVSNLLTTELNIIADESPLLRGTAVPNSELYIYIINANGEVRRIGPIAVGPDGKFLFELPALLDGEYTIIIQNIDPKTGEVLSTSKELRISIQKNFEINAPEIISLEGQKVEENKKIAIQIRRPKLFGTADIGNIVIVQWKSAIFASALISDSVGGNFVVAAPSDLEIGDHTVYAYAVNQQGNIRSKEVKIDFSIGEKEVPWGDEYEPRRKVALIIFSTILVILIQVRRMGKNNTKKRGGRLVVSK